MSWRMKSTMEKMSMKTAKISKFLRGLSDTTGCLRVQFGHLIRKFPEWRQSRAAGQRWRLELEREQLAENICLRQIEGEVAGFLLLELPEAHQRSQFFRSGCASGRALQGGLGKPWTGWAEQRQQCRLLAEKELPRRQLNSALSQSLPFSLILIQQWTGQWGYMFLFCQRKHLWQPQRLCFCFGCICFFCFCFCFCCFCFSISPVLSHLFSVSV